MMRKAPMAIASKTRKIARLSGVSVKACLAGRIEPAALLARRRSVSVEVLRHRLEHARRPGLGELVDRRARRLHEGGAVGLDLAHLVLGDEFLAGLVDLALGEVVAE